MPSICKGLMDAGMEGTMPAAVLERGTTSRQRKVVSDVAHLVESSERAGIKAPAIIVVGEVCTLEKDFEWAEKKGYLEKDSS